MPQRREIRPRRAPFARPGRSPRPNSGFSTASAKRSAPATTAFLTSLAVRDQVAASTQNQALSALLFLYRDVLSVGLRLLECCRLRVKDVDFGANQIVIRDGKGNKDRVTMLPAAVRADLARHLEHVRKQHQVDLRQGAGWVELPWALARKYPNAGREWGWQWVFPATRMYLERLTGQRRRHHLHDPCSSAP